MRGESRKTPALEKKKKAERREGTEEKIEQKLEEGKIEEEIEKEIRGEEGEEIEKEREIHKISVEETKKLGTTERLALWKPKTKLGKMVKEGIVTNINEIFEKKMKIMEREIVEMLLPNLSYEMTNIGQARGKFGGGKRRVWRQVQKKGGEGNIPKFSTMVIVGNKDGYVGIGYGKAKETLPAKEKAIRNAEINIFKVVRGCGSFDCVCNEEHSIPYIVEGKCSGVRVILKPAPKGTGIVADDEIKKIFVFAGIKDIYVKSFGQTRTKFNHLKAVIDALKKLEKMI